MLDWTELHICIAQRMRALLLRRGWHGLFQPLTPWGSPGHAIVWALDG